MSISQESEILIPDMITFYELNDVVLLPTVTNQGHPGNKINFYVRDENDITGIAESFPIFTSPMDSIIGSANLKAFIDSGIKPVIPGTEPLDVRLNLCSWVFCAFSINEIEQNFLSRKRAGNSQFHLCIDAGNGHDVRVLNAGLNLRRLYENQVLLMGGNVALPEVYKDYSNAGFDYVRFGISSGSLVDVSRYGFHYPMASLLDDLKNYRTNGVGKGLRKVKVIADGGISSPSDVVKAIACGADYVMIGREFAKLIEANGRIFKVGKNAEGFDELIEINLGSIQGWSGAKAAEEGIKRQYMGNTSHEIRARREGYKDTEEWEKGLAGILVSDSSWDWVNVDSSLPEWTDNLRECIYYAFMMTSSLGWEDFKKNAKYGVMGTVQ